MQLRMTTASAPGRANLIGEHTDHSGGYVLPVALPLRVMVELTPRADRALRLSSTAIGGGIVERTLDDRPAGDWTDHVVGAARVAGVERGFDARVTSDLPIGVGLGSSGALAVAVLRALRGAFGLALHDVALALLAQRSENEFVGARSGIMDQYAASLGREGEALFLDCRSLENERIRLPQAFEVVVVDSGIRHEHATGEYNKRRRDCEEAARLLGVSQLREVGSGELARVAELPEPLRRRARHVVTENARVIQAVVALRSADPVALGGLLDASHRSLRDDFAVSTPEVDLLVELLREQEAVHGARIHGGGFGGSAVALSAAGEGHEAAARAVGEYEERTGLDARIVVPALRL